MLLEMYSDLTEHHIGNMQKTILCPSLVLKILFKLFTFLCATPQTNGAAATMFYVLKNIITVAR